MPDAPATYRPRRWRCEHCGRTGQVLLHRLDTDGRARQRRATSHRSQIRRERCAGDRLVWVDT